MKLSRFFFVSLTPKASLLQCTDEEARPGGVAGGAGFIYDDHPALNDGGTTLAVGYERTVGRGGVVYCALGHW